MSENEMMPQDSKKTQSSHKYIKTVIILVAVSVVLIILSTVLIGLFTGEEEEREFPPVDPSKLEETKEEDFDIMEYDEYLDLDRSVMLEVKGMNMSISIDENDSRKYGEGIELVYKMLSILIEGDYEAYNAMVSEDVGHYEWFSQQQIYDIAMYEYSKEEKEGKSGSYTEYVIKLKYRIHENNGSYRNNITPDSSRPQYIVINDSTGRFMIMDIIDTVGW